MAGKEKQRVLMIVRDDSRFQDLMLEQEVFVMRDLIKSAGFAIDVATVNDQPLTGELTLTPDLNLEDVKIEEYAGLMLPCMAPEPDPKNTMPDEVVQLIRLAKGHNLPMGAMRGSVRELGRAGVLDGRLYSFAGETKLPEFSRAKFNGTGVTKDGSVVTAGSCPAVAKHQGGADETTALTLAFLEILGVKSPPTTI